jgi:hypothetical protein
MALSRSEAEPRRMEVKADRRYRHGSALRPCGPMVRMDRLAIKCFLLITCLRSCVHVSSSNRVLLAVITVVACSTTPRRTAAERAADADTEQQPRVR